MNIHFPLKIYNIFYEQKQEILFENIKGTSVTTA